MTFDVIRWDCPGLCPSVPKMCPRSGAYNEGGDDETAAVCRDALDGDQAAWYACGEYILEMRAEEGGIQTVT